MTNRSALVCAGFIALGVCILFPLLAQAQTPIVASRITQAVDENRLATLRGNTHPLARPQNDRGAAPPSLPMERMLLVLKRSPEQETALDALLDQQQDNSSPSYHQWLTPDQFGQQFGPSDQDIQAITSWLQWHGFQVAHVSRGRTSIEFSGTASQVQDAFHTAIHRYTVSGQDHWANSSDPQIPVALTSVVAGINTLHNFPREAMHHVAGLAARSKSTGKVTLAEPSLYSLGGNCGVPGVGCNAVGPFDFATIYNVLPLWNAAPTHIDGTGQTIAIVGESDISAQDVTAFRDYFGLSSPKLQIIVDGPDPGIVPGEETESDLDVEWAGAVAPNATIDFVTSESTEASLGVDLSAQYIVDNNLAPILSESYGICELFLGTAGNQFYNQLWQQAAAQGITVLVAAGDSGSAVCDRNAGTQGATQFGLSVSGISSTPYNVSVGGTDFNDLTSPSTYWATTNSTPPLPGNPSALPTVSALSYIPETTWNDTCTNSVFGDLLGYSKNAETNCNNSQLINLGFVNVIGGSGGKSACTNSDGQTISTCTGGYTKPSWQTGSGVPGDGKRDVPDVSLFAAINSPSGSFYVVCEADFNPNMVSCDPTNPNTDFLAVGGTSASTPALAGIMALVNQETQSRQGNANYVLYKLATQQPSAFHDVPVGGTIAMPCVTGTRDCTTSNPGDKNGVLAGYSTTTGYDLATGLGSVNVNNLVTKWTTVTAGSKATATSLTISPVLSPIPHGTAVPISITVTPNPPSSGTPTGQVSLITSAGESAGSFTLASNGSLAPGTTTNLLPGGNYTVTAHYAGDGTFAQSDSFPMAVTVAPEASKVQLAYELFNPVSGQETNPNATTAVFGTPALLRINVTSNAGDACPQNAAGESSCPTGHVTVTDNGNPLDAGTYPLNTLGYAEDQAIVLTGGTHSIIATYPVGDGSYSASSPTTDVITIAKAPTTISLAPVSPQTSITGNFVDVTATVSTQVLNPPASALPTGSGSIVQFFAGSTPIQLDVNTSVTYTVNTAPSGNAQVIANLVTSEISPGINPITAQYNGDKNYSASPISASQQVDVLIRTTTSASPSSFSIQHGQSVTLTAQVTPSQTGGPQLTGNVQFYITNMTLGTVPVVNGEAQITTSSLPGGVITIGVAYSGDANYAQSLGGTFVSVALLPTTTALGSSSASIRGGTPVTFTATVTPTQSGGPALSGSVQFSYCVSNVCGFSAGSVPVSNGQAQITTTNLLGGTLLVTALYSGDANYASSSSSAVSENVSAITTTTTVLSSNSAAPTGSSITFTAQVTSASSDGAPLSGTIQFTGNGSPLASLPISSNDKAQFIISSLAIGYYQIIANYSGDSDYSASTSAVITETITPPPTFTVGANPTAINVSAPGQAGSTLLTFTSQNGLTGMNMTVSAACTGLPSEATCSFSPKSSVTSTTISLPANGSTTATFYILTTAPSSAVPTANNRPVSFGRSTTREVAPLACVIGAGMLMLAIRRKRVRSSTAFALVLFAFVIATAACGGGGGSSSSGGGGGGNPSNPGTPITQNAPISVSLTIGTASQSVPNLTVTVQ